ncbi:uncharacterized protein FFB20_15269 [Fusarium fujikuroi]|uniref:Uncharacterized protein n=1 Tax=Fusarium fujikuroi TaxID=5127 RepID=A0A9Q9RV56_FUSFU|nr:uncharacterized protein FFE2_12676 [Fusarium fujikuroi]SCO17510.1 uncharacterized protein FFB20_15269 [Fusarium fujikuroi]SCO50789.1 uncharacterized protein FFNC_13365 [Fusarium fujikuroi]VTT77988.1 unnamed protein product [Fusarium fujikuroi]VZI02408.1 unnamed protein product [Fusarium fujikuroi]
MKSRMEQASLPREKSKRKRTKQRAREKALRSAREFFSGWLDEPHPTTVLVIKEAVSVLWPGLRLDPLSTHPPLLGSSKSFFSLLSQINASGLINLVDLFETTIRLRGTPLCGLAGSPTVRMRPVGPRKLEVSYTMPESELPDLIAIQAAEELSCLARMNRTAFLDDRYVTRPTVPENSGSPTILGHKKHKCTVEWRLLHYFILNASPLSLSLSLCLLLDVLLSHHATMLLPAQPSVAHGISRKRPSSDALGREDTGTHCDCGILHSNEKIRNDRCETLDIRVKKSKPEKILDGGIAGDGTIHGDSATNPTTADGTGDRSITDNDLIDGGLMDDGIGDDESKCSTESILCYQEIEPLAMEPYDLLVFPTDDSTWHTYVVNHEQLPPSLKELPSVHIVGFLSNRNCVVAVASCIRQRFYDAYAQHLSPEELAGEDIFTNVLKPTAFEIAKYGLEVAKEKRRSDVLRRAVRGVTCPGGLALYLYYKKIINHVCDLLPIEWALLRYDLRLLKPEVLAKFVLSSIFLELHFVQDLNGDAVSHLLEKKKQDGCQEYLATKESSAITNVTENANDQMHEILLLRGLLAFAGHQTSISYDKYDQDRSIDDRCLILGQVLYCVFYPEHGSKAPERMRIPRPLGADDVQERLTQSGYSATNISELLANIAIFLLIAPPVPYHETLQATLVNRLRWRVVMDAIHEISDTYVLHLPDLEGEENDMMLLLLYLAKKGLESKVTRTWMTSEEGQRMYGQILTHIREQAQSFEQFTLSVHILLAYSHLLDSFEQVLEPVYGCSLRDFSFLLHGDKQVNRRGTLEIVARHAGKVLTGRSAGTAQAVTFPVEPSSGHWSDGLVAWYCQHRSTGVMTHDEAYRKTGISTAKFLPWAVSSLMFS